MHWHKKIQVNWDTFAIEITEEKWPNYPKSTLLHYKAMLYVPLFLING